MKKILFFILLFGIFQLSNTSNLHVIDPSTWFNGPEYEKNLPIKKFFSLEGDFFFLYDDIYNINFIVHKLSHILFFSLLTILAYLNFNKKALLSWLFVVGYALFDEIHQSFIVGRSGRALDVILDSTASLITIILIVIIRKLIKRKQKTIEKRTILS